MKSKETYTPFVETIFEENENLHIIAFKKDAVIAYDKKDNNKAYFFYDCSDYTGLDGFSFSFNLLSECNDSISAWFKMIIEKLHYKLDTKETENDYFNTLTPNF